MTDFPETSPNLGLPFYQTKLNEFEVQHNEALLMLDTLVMLAVKDRDLSAPPSSPALGDRYLVKATGTGDFAGKDNRIAQYDTGGWNFYAPQAGWTCYVQDEELLIAWNGTAWHLALDVLGGMSEIENLSKLGLGTTADSTNPLSAKLNNTLWTAKTVAEGGDGTLRYKLSKEDASKTLSFLFQDNFSGRAEIGLTGDDDFHFKVSPDGSTWHDAILIDRSSGRISFPSSDIDLRLAELAMGVADAMNVAQFLGSAGNRFADSFDVLTYVNTGGATNFDSGTAGLLKATIGIGTGVTAASSTPNSNSSGWSGYTIRQCIAAAQLSNTGNPFTRVTFNASSAASYQITDVFIGAAASAGSASFAGTPTRLKFGGSNGVTVSAGGTAVSDWASFTISTGTDIVIAVYVNGSAGSDALRSLSSLTGWSGQYKGGSNDSATVAASGYSSSSNAVIGVSKVETAPTATNNLTVASTGLTAVSAPSSLKIVAMVNHVVSATPGTDYKFKVSRDGGSHLSSYLTLNDRFTVPGGSLHVIESDAIDVTGITSGTTPLWQFETANNKMVELQGIYLYWA